MRFVRFMCDLIDLRRILPDNWTVKRIHTSEDLRRVPGRVFSDGINGREFVSSYTNGFRS